MVKLFLQMHMHDANRRSLGAQRGYLFLNEGSPTKRIDIFWL
jgi:hypothetical protein